MEWGAALRATFRPALLTGPMIGALGGLGVILVSMFADLRSGMEISAITGVGVVAMVVGTILGLVIASPIALVAGAAMLRMAEGNARWFRRRAWALAGLATGAVAGFLIGTIIDGGPVGAVIAALFGALGLIGALLCRRMLRGTIDARTKVDIDIFA